VRTNYGRGYYPPDPERGDPGTILASYEHVVPDDYAGPPPELADWVSARNDLLFLLAVVGGAMAVWVITQ
jgi:hypothetical protein